MASTSASGRPVASEVATRASTSGSLACSRASMFGDGIDGHDVQPAGHQGRGQLAGARAQVEHAPRSRRQDPVQRRLGEPGPNPVVQLGRAVERRRQLDPRAVVHPRTVTGGRRRRRRTRTRLQRSARPRATGRAGHHLSRAGQPRCSRSDRRVTSRPVGEIQSRQSTSAKERSRPLGSVPVRSGGPAEPVDAMAGRCRPGRGDGGGRRHGPGAPARATVPVPRRHRMVVSPLRRPPGGPGTVTRERDGGCARQRRSLSRPCRSGVALARLVGPDPVGHSRLGCGRRRVETVLVIVLIAFASCGTCRGPGS